MRALKVIVFLIGVLVVVVGLALLVHVRIQDMREDGQVVGPQNWVSFIESVSRFWRQFTGGVPIYATGVVVLFVGILLMSIPIALPKSQRR